MCVPVKPQRIMSATLAPRRSEYFAKYYLSTVFAGSFVMKIHIQNKWESANKFLLWEAKQNEVFSSKFFQSSLLKHAGEVFLFCV